MSQCMIAIFHSQFGTWRDNIQDAQDKRSLHDSTSPISKNFRKWAQPPSRDVQTCFSSLLGLLGNWCNAVKICCLYTSLMLKFHISTFNFPLSTLKFWMSNFKFPHQWCSSIVVLKSLSLVTSQQNLCLFIINRPRVNVVNSW